jgi:hypothetical protein
MMPDFACHRMLTRARQYYNTLQCYLRIRGRERIYAQTFDNVVISYVSSLHPAEFDV